jgi:CBS domain containing-hemolysin-like protein
MLGPLIAGILCAALAFALVLADAALVAVEQDGDDVVRLTHASAHRALAFARMLAQIGAGAATARAFDIPNRPLLQSFGIALAAAAIVVVLAETAAREIGDAAGGRALGALQPLVRITEIVFAPVLSLNEKLDEALRRALPPADADDASREETAEQFREVIASEADVSREERSILAGVFSLGDTAVSDIMVPRVDILAVDREAPWSEVVDRVRSAEHSRLPVFEETIDDIVGMLYAKDLLAYVIADEPPADGWMTLIRPAVFVPPTKRVDTQLRDFRASGTHIAVVADEYGGTAGLVTIEDVLEEIVGEIRDEYDDEERPITFEGPDRFWVSGRVTLDELSEATSYPFEHDEVATVGGLIYELLGRVPRAGERLTIGPFRVVVERVVRRQVRRVYFERVRQPEPETASA